MDDADMDLLMALADEAEEEPPAVAKPAPPRAPPAMAPPAPKPVAGRAAPSALQEALGPTLQRAAAIPGFSAGIGGAHAVPAPRPQPGRPIADGYVDATSGFRVGKPVIGSLVLRDRLTDGDTVYLGIKDISPSREYTGRWATMGALVSKVQASGRDGSSYSRWTLSDLAGKQVTLFLWRKAAAEHYKELEGSLLLLWSPQVRRDEGGGGGGSGPGFSLHIDKPEMLQRPGLAADFGFCRGMRKDGQRCTYPINKTTCEYCPYHAQAALRSLSSGRSDMAGANLLQRGLLPQARAAQKQVANGRAPAGMNSLIARPLPPARHLPGGAAGGGGRALLGGRPVAPGSTGGGSGGGAAGAMMAPGTGAYGSAADHEPSGGGGGGVGGGGGGKRSYGAQLLANMQERQSAEEALEEGGPDAKRRRSEWQTGDAAKTRAVAAARAAGKLGAPQQTPSQAHRGTTMTGPGAVPGGGGAAAGAAGPSGSGGGARPAAVLVTGPRFARPTPLPAHLASLLKPPAAAPAAGAAAGGAGGAAGPSGRSGGAAAAAARPASAPPRPRFASASGGAPPTARGAIAAAAANAPAAKQQQKGKQQQEEIELEEEEDLVVLDDEEDGGEGLGLGAAEVAAAEPASVELEEEEGEHDAAAAAAAGAAGVEAQEGSGDGGKSGGGGGGGEDEDCGLDVLMAMFPELQEEEGNEAADAQGAERPSSKQAAAAGAGAGASQRGGQAAPTQPRATPATQQAAAGTVTATGLLPRVAGLGATAPPAARAAEARRQQAAAAKARAEKVKTLGLKNPAAMAPPPPRPLGAANTGAYGGGSGAYGGGGGAAATANTGLAAATALALAKGLAPPRSNATTAARAATSGHGGGGGAAASGGGSSAMAAAFGSLLQQRLPNEMAAAESRYSELSEEAAGDAVISMLEGLEARDALVTQLDSVMQLKVTAWHCAQCDRLCEFMDKACRADGHTLSKASVLKRFWSCDHCNARITTLGVRFPANRCSRCNNPSLDFTSCSMYRGPRELKPAGMAAAAGLAGKDNLFATLDAHPELGRRTFR